MHATSGIRSKLNPRINQYQSLLLFRSKWAVFWCTRCGNSNYDVL